MARRLPGIRQRLEYVALDLYAREGFANTTVRRIADEAGTTERTFFRHFRDKVDVVFGDEERLLQEALDAARRAPARLGPVDVVVVGMSYVAEQADDHREVIVRRARVVAAEPALHERELGRSGPWITAFAEVLRARGLTEPDARLAATIGLTTFRSALERWVEGDGYPSLVSVLSTCTADLRRLVASRGRTGTPVS